MINGLKPYPEMKESGFPWLGRVPKHWAVLPNRALFVEVKERDHPNEDMLSVTILRGVVRQSVLLEETSKKDASNVDRSAYKLVQPGDIAYNKMRAWQGAIGASSFRGIVSPAYVVVRPRDASSTAYFHELFRTPMFAKEAERWSYGITSDMWSLRPEHFRMIYSAVPPADEQAAIVRLLNHAEARIRRYIAAKQKLIKLLEEEKQVIVHRAVTCGLDPNVRFKPSGVEWLGEVPEHWEVLTLRRVIRRAVDGPHHSPDYHDSGIPFLSARNIKTDRWNLDDAKFISEKDYEEFCKRVIPEVGDVLYTKGGTTGVARAVDLDFRFQIWVHVAVLKVRRDKVEPGYLALILNSPRCYEQAQLFTRGATNQDLGLGRMKAIIFALPPLSQQHEILKAVDENVRDIQQAIVHARQEIDLLREYRNRLIADVVTGKLDVREAAAKLPEIATETEPLDETDDLPQDEELAEAAELEAKDAV
jgi:type I restriction enzyme S subunit